LWPAGLRPCNTQIGAFLCLKAIEKQKLSKGGHFFVCFFAKKVCKNQKAALYLQSSSKESCQVFDKQK